MVIDELPIGSVIRFGRFSFAKRVDTVDIYWIKVSKDNHFISERVLLGTRFDEYEPEIGFNENYELSNIRQFMNSDAKNWYMPTHQYDRPTDWCYLENGTVIRMLNYGGLLQHFTDEELCAFEKEFGDYLRLPTVNEMLGGFPYFKRHGRRALPTDDWGFLERRNYCPGMFSSYFVIDVGGSSTVNEFDRRGHLRVLSPNEISGVRPVCKLKANIEAFSIGENTYEMNLSSATPVKYFEETRSLDWLLGL